MPFLTRFSGGQGGSKPNIVGGVRGGSKPKFCSTRFACRFDPPWKKSLIFTLPRHRLFLSLCMYECMYVYMLVCMYACLCVRIYLCMHTCI